MGDWKSPVGLITLWLIILGDMSLVWSNTYRFLSVPQNLTAIEGDTVTFACSANVADDEFSYSWLHNDKPLQNSSHRHQHFGSNLRITSVSYAQDSGDYVCVATSPLSGASLASPPAQLIIISLRKASVALVSHTDRQVILKCKIEGTNIEGITEIEWYRNNEKLTSLEDVKLQRNRLYIRNPHRQDHNGLYRCTASNVAGRIASTRGFRLEIGDTARTMGNCLQNQFLCRRKRGGSGRALFGDDSDALFPPAGVMIKNDDFAMDGLKKVKEKESVQLHCPYEIPDKFNDKEIQLSWRKDGKLLRQVELKTTTMDPQAPPMQEESRITVNKQSGSLVIASVIAPDAGKYVCQISVEGHRPVNSHPKELVVIEHLKFVPQPTSKNLELGSMAKIYCKAQGSPSPEIKWLRDSDSERNWPDSIEDINGTLTFKNVSAEHRGNYTCVARNTREEIRATVVINVVVAPKFSVAPQSSVEAAVSDRVMLHCQATGDPRPTIQWDKDLEYLSENNTDEQRFRILENGTLEILDAHLEDEGRYGCTIGNSAGLKREEVHFTIKQEKSERFIITRAVLITTSVALAYIILVVGLMIWCRCRRQARKARLNRENLENGDRAKENEPCLGTAGADSSSSPKSQHNDMRKMNGNLKEDAGNPSSKRSHTYDQLTLPRNIISELIQIGRSEFGDVFVGKIANFERYKADEGPTSAPVGHPLSKRRSKNSMDDIEEIKEEDQAAAEDGTGDTKEYKLVLVKALNKVKDEYACQEFQRQIELFRSLAHESVVSLYGLCREKDPHYMVLEYTDWGDLKQFLLATAGKINTSTNSSSPPPLQTKQILAVAYHIARGMDALHRARVTHRDLATRNCVISSEFIVKISYPALCKDKYSREYFKHRNVLLPIRWMAPECIQEDEYTSKSDVFSFGVVVWELFNQAIKIPFEGLSNEEVIQQSQSNKLSWSCAEGTPDSLKQVLLSCWQANPKERPSFSQLCTALSKAIQNDKL